MMLAASAIRFRKAYAPSVISIEQFSILAIFSPISILKHTSCTIYNENLDIVFITPTLRSPDPVIVIKIDVEVEDDCTNTVSKIPRIRPQNGFDKMSSACSRISFRPAPPRTIKASDRRPSDTKNIYKKPRASNTLNGFSK